MRGGFHRSSYVSPIGEIEIITDGSGLRGLSFGPADDTTRKADDDLLTLCTMDWLDAYFSGSDPGEPPPISVEGTPFSRAVWEVTRSIGYGMTSTYGDVALSVQRLTGRRVSPRAVGNALSRNPIAIVIPCHRVLRTDGDIGGYSWGRTLKAMLLRIEGTTS